MAYGNWGAFVYKDGARQENREDNTPYKEEELKPGYYQAFGIQEGMDAHHASLGDGPIRLCGYKSWPRLYWEGQSVDLLPYQKGDSAGTDNWYFHESDGIEGELNGYKFKAWPCSDPESVDMELIQPDGVKWTGKSGYGMGAGFE